MEKLGIIIVIEHGDLEQKTKLLIDSIRTFGGEIKDSKIWAVKPRKGKAISNETLSFLKGKNVEFIDIDLNKHWYLYGHANKIYATAYIEEHFGCQYETLLFLDSDTIVIDAIDPNILEGKYEVAVKPIDGQHLAITKEEDLSDFWRLIYNSCGFSIKDIWTVQTTIDEIEIFAYFNSGVIFTRSGNQVFSQWRTNFERFAENKEGYHLRAMEYFFIEQALLAGTILQKFPKEKVKVLNHFYNYSLNFKAILVEKNKAYYDQIKILHYHKMFQGEPSDISFLSQKVFEWLNPQLPLPSYKDGFLKKYYKVFRYIIWRLKNKLLFTLMQS